MPNPLSRKDKRLSFFAAIFFLTAEAGAAPSSRLPEPFCDTPIVAPLNKSADKSSRYIHTEKNCDLVIHIPDAASRSYRIIFFDKDQLLFEVNLPGEPMLVMEKNNFLHAGLFRYELYQDNALVERNHFIIKKE